MLIYFYNFLFLRVIYLNLSPNGLFCKNIIFLKIESNDIRTCMISITPIRQLQKDKKTGIE